MMAVKMKLQTLNSVYCTMYHRKGDYDMSTGKKRLVEYKPYQLSETSRKEFTENISKGLLILCELTATLKGQIALTY